MLLKQILDENPSNKQAAVLLKEAELSGFWSTMERVLYLLLLFSAGLMLFWWLYNNRERFFVSFLSFLAPVCL